ncbi:MAG: right-handed parallel beta-helix repeat-containing protein [Gemmatimonadales bacterium]|nr:right-handed parallel beta-helix repeat-containing protein [Gemmatimonadales bacterium]
MMAGALLLLTGLAANASAPCVRPNRAGIQVQGEVRICPGRYRIADPSERGVIIAAASGTRIDLSGVVLESGDSVPGRFVGSGVTSRGVDGVSILGGTVRGYRFGVRLEGGRGHRITGMDLSGSRRQPLRSTPERADTADRLDPFRPRIFLAYGGGILLQGTTGASVTGITARGAQNGIGLVEARESYLADNLLTGNTGWAIHLWRSSRNHIVRNRADQTRRCAALGAECGSAALLIRERSDSNTIAENDLSSSSTGLWLTGARPLAGASVGNLIYRNDASHASGSGFLAAYSWNISFLENRVDGAQRGFRLDHVNGSTLRANTVIGAREAAITADHGHDNTIESNVLLDARVGIRVSAAKVVAGSRGYRIDDNVLGGTQQGVVLEQTTHARVRGNLFDRVGDGLVVDAAGHGTEVSGNVFLRASGWFIEAPDLNAGGNFWATADAAAAGARVKGRISVRPWRPASAAGY